MARRQRVRKALIIVSFILFPVTIYYFSPVLIIESASAGVINGSFITFTLLFLSSLILGRGFCGWVCPGAGLQERLFSVRDKKARGGKLNWIKYFIWVPWLATIAILAVRAGGYHRIDPFFRTWYGISVYDLQGIIILAFFVGLIAVLALATGRRGFCHYACWMAPFMVIGIKVSNMVGWPALRLVSDKSKCKDCKTCSGNCPMSLDVNGMVQKGSMYKMYNSECILCGTCVDNCPNGAIGYSFHQQ